MSREVVVTGMGLVSPFGYGPDALFEALWEGRDEAGSISLFQTENLNHQLGLEVRDFSPASILGNHNFRPLNRVARFCAVATFLTLEDSGWKPQAIAENELGLVLGTMFCSAATIAEFDRNAMINGAKYAKPLDFANTVINAAAGQTAIWHGLTGMNSTIAAGQTSGLQALTYAARQIRSGRADALIAGGAEELSFETFMGFYRAGLLAGSGRRNQPFPIPFDVRRNGFILGEGAAFLMLEAGEFARARGARILARIDGSGSGFDASRGKDRDRAVNQMVNASQKALDQAGLGADDIDCVSVSANGSPRMDHYEALALNRIFTEAVPVTATKSVLGETLGAAGAFQAVALIESMRRGRLAGIRDFGRGEDALVQRGDSGVRQNLIMKRGLIQSMAFDGGSCSLVLSLQGEAS